MNPAYTIVQWGAVSGGPYNSGSSKVNYPGTNLTINRAGAGVGTICYVAFSVDTNGLTSAASNEACKTVNAPVANPSPPLSFTVQ